MRRVSVILCLSSLVLVASMRAQQPPPPAQQGQQGQQSQQGQGQQGQQGQQGRQGQQPAAPIDMRPASQASGSLQPNVKIDVTFIDTLGGDTPVRKTVSMLVYGSGGGRQGRIRASGARGQGYINIDAVPSIMGEGVYLNLSIEYMPELAPDNTQRVGPLSQSLTFGVPSGKAVVVAQSADPGTSRRVTVEVTATILK